VRAEVLGWTVALDRMQLIARPEGIFSTIREARSSLEPVLRAWEFMAEVAFHHHSFAFSFDSAETAGAVIDVNDHHPEPRSYLYGPSDDLIILQGVYPPAPGILVTEEMTLLWQRLKRSLWGIGEPITSCAYYALTLVERHGGGRPGAAALFKIDTAVLRKCGELTSTRGDPATARKAVPNGKPLTDREIRWLEQLTRHILLRLGTVAADGEPDWLRLNDMVAIG
jgi:hypothetical protein